MRKESSAAIRLLVLPRYSRLGASSRLRTYQFVPWFERAGFEVHVHPLLDDNYIRGLYEERATPISILRGYATRVATLMASQRFDAILIEKEALPWLPITAELFRFPKDLPIIVDYDDAVFHNYDQNPSRLVRMLLGNKIDKIMRQASLVTVGNAYLGARAEAAGCTNVAWLPTVIDLERYPTLPRLVKADAPLVIGWVGTPSSAWCVKLIADAVARLRPTRPIRCVAVGARPDQVEGTPFEAHMWSEASEFHTLRRFDIGIMPLRDAPWERGKCGYKLIQYMACGLPVVASPVGVNKEIVEHGVNGFLAESAESWIESLSLLIDDATLRARMGANGRMRVEQDYCLQVQGPRFAELIKRLVVQ